VVDNTTNPEGIKEIEPRIDNKTTTIIQISPEEISNYDSWVCCRILNRLSEPNAQYGRLSLQYACNLNSKRFESYIDHLLRRDAISEHTCTNSQRKYYITKNGIILLELLKKYYNIV
jgi:predicted transcriptional regulator